MKGEGVPWVMFTVTKKPPFLAVKKRLAVTMLEQDELVYYRYLDGDDSGLVELMERYGNRLTLYINGIIHDLHDAEDLMIEAFSRMVAKKPRLNDHGFQAYLFKTGRNLALRYAAKNRLRASFGFEELEQEPEGAELVEDVVRQKELSNILRLSMAQIKPDYREALYLLYFEGVSRAEAAQIMKKAEKQIDNLAYRGKQALRLVLEKEGITNAQY
ncbi:MAG: RNA polymerase sigma factor [Angelakisella sp.]